ALAAALLVAGDVGGDGAIRRGVLVGDDARLGDGERQMVAAATDQAYGARDRRQVALEALQIGEHDDALAAPRPPGVLERRAEAARTPAGFDGAAIGQLDAAQPAVLAQAQRLGRRRGRELLLVPLARFLACAAPMMIG